MDKKEELLLQFPFWNNLKADEKELLKRVAVIKKYDKGQMIHSEGDECLGAILVVRGEIRVYILSEEGREITLFRIRKGEPCVFSAACVISQITFDTQIVAEKETEILVINASVFSKLTKENIYVKCFVYELATQRFSTVMWTMQQILFYGFDRRLATFLLGEYERTGKKTIKMTHEQIAKDLGSAREVVARMLKKFASDGLVEVKRGMIILKDITALEDIT